MVHSRKRIRRGLLVMLLAMIGVGASYPAQADGTPVTATIVEVQPIVHVLRLSATTVSPRVAKVSTAVGGLVDTMRVDLGDRVQRGDVLLELDRAVVLQDVKRAQAAVSEAEARLADEERRLRIAERLIKRGNVPENELEARQAQVRIATAALERLEAEVARERERLKQHSINAPFDGVVADKATEAGEWVSPGATVVELVSIGDLRIDIPVPQKYFPQLARETPVELSFDALPGQAFNAERVALVPVSDPTARTFTLRVRLSDQDVALTPGMSARAAIHLSTGERGNTIPRDAVIRHPDGRATVWVIEGEADDLKVSERQVELGRPFDGRIHVVGGLKTGERVVVRGNESLRQDQRVRVTNGSS